MNFDQCKRCDQPSPYIQKTDSIKFKNADQIFENKRRDDMHLKSLIYCISCAGCEKDYIDQTVDYLRKQVSVHRQQINDPDLRQTDLSSHLATCAKGRDPQFHIIPFFKSRKKIKPRERLWKIIL